MTRPMLLPVRRRTAVLLSAALAVPGVAALQSPAHAATGPGVDDIFTTDQNTSRPIDVLANDTANGGRFQEGSGQNATAQHGTITPTFGSGKAAPTYTPDAGFTGIDTVTYSALDLSSQPYTASARIVVGNEPCTDPTVPSDQTVIFMSPGATDTQTVTIPIAASDVRVSMCGAQGGPTPGNASYAHGGPGGYAEATLNNGAPLTADLDLSIVPGAAGDGTAGRRAAGGGGAAAAGGQGGGGASLLYATSDLTTPLLVAGGGGGAGANSSACVDGGNGGVGGGLEGGDGLPYFPYNPGGGTCTFVTSAPVGEGGTQSAGGTSPVPGGDGTFRDGGNATGAAGAGGGGWYGGGAGSPSTGPSDVDAPGGGGSGHVASGGALGISGTTLGNGHTGDGAVRISYVTPAPPAFTSASISDSPTAGISYSRTVTASGGPRPAITFTTLPPGLSYVDHGDGTATISGTPTTPGTYNFTATADNGQPPPATQAERIQVMSGPGQPPPASPTASPSASPSASATSSPAGRRSLTLTTSRPDIHPTQIAPVTAVGQAGQAIELRCYTRPSTAYRTVRTATINAAGDPVTFELKPGQNTRCFVQYAVNPTAGASTSLVISVHTTLSLSAVRTGVRTYRFQGRNLPRLAGQLITIYRIDGQGNEIRTANAKTDSSGTYYVPGLGQPGRHFTGTGTFSFIARTSATLNNAAGQSALYRLTIR